MTEYYDFKTEDAYSFAHKVGIKTNIKGSEMVFQTCPYCRSQKDKNTFSINVNTGQFQCKRASCAQKGNMITLAKDFGIDLGKGFNDYYNIDNCNARFKNFGYFAQREVDKVAIEYMIGRGISPNITQRYQVTVRKDDNNILVFPFLNEKQELITIKYRHCKFDAKIHKNKEWFERGMKPILFGIFQCKDFTKVVITEGQIDTLSVAEAGFDNVVSVPNGANGFTWIPHCWDWLNKFEEIIVFGDCEKGNITLIDTIKTRFSRSTIKCVKVSDYQECKDANEILQKHGKEAIINAINNAQVITSDGIKRAEDVERIDFAEIPHFTTGFESLNKSMEGGLRGGDLLVVTGERGDGKSTFVSQMACFMLNNIDAKIFMYSGELVDSQVMEWMHSQLSGTKMYDAETLNKMREWYSGRLFLYDNEYITDDAYDVYNRCVTAIQKYGCNIIILDNLMSAMGSNDTDIYRAQSKFARDCARLAKEYKVVVILIAHPNKNGQHGDNNAVSGSADITNNATYIVWYQRTDKIASNCRNLILSKNRTNGELIKEGELILEYDKSNRRIYEAQNGNDYVFGWSFVEDGFYEVGEQVELPF